MSVVRGNGYRCECESGFYGQKCHNRCPKKGARISGRFGKLLGILVDCIWSISTQNIWTTKKKIILMFHSMNLFFFYFIPYFFKWFHPSNTFVTITLVTFLQKPSMYIVHNNQNIEFQNIPIVSSSCNSIKTYFP